MINKIITPKDTDLNRQLDEIIANQFTLDPSIASMTDAEAGTIVTKFNALLAALQASK